MEEEKVIVMKRKYEKSNDFKQHYVTGAIWGFKNQYDFRLSFYNVDSNDFLLKTQKFKEEGGLDKNKIAKKVSEMEMPYKIVCEVIMTEQAVRELHNFLGRELKSFEERSKEEKV